MEYLLDTHTLLWLLFSPGKLPENVREILHAKKNKCLISMVSFWEIATKMRIGKLLLNGQSLQDVKDECLRLRFVILPVSFENIIAYLNLPFFKNHRDPFDRMLIATAVARRIPLISRDARLVQYDGAGLMHVW